MVKFSLTTPTSTTDTGTDTDFSAPAVIFAAFTLLVVIGIKHFPVSQEKIGPSTPFDAGFLTCFEVNGSMLNLITFGGTDDD